MEKRLFFSTALALFFIVNFFPINFAHANYQKIAPGNTVTLGEFVFDDNFIATTTPCTIGITDPSNFEVAPTTTLMTANNDGWHYYNYTATSGAASGVWPSVMICGSAIAGDLVKVDKSFIVDRSILSTSTIKEVVDASLAIATSSLETAINSNTNAVVSSASSSLFASLPSAIWSFSGRTLTSFGNLVASTTQAVWTSLIRTLTGATLDSGSLATQSDINTATSTLTTEIVKGYTVTLSDFGASTVNTAYKAKLQVLNYAAIPTDADSLPTVTITDSAGTVQVSAGVMTKDPSPNGTYSYSYSIGGSAVGGVWETVVSTTINGQTVKRTDYWNLSSSPADVDIIEITDKVIPTITASVRIDNKGTSASDFYYIYCIVSSESNLCGGNDDIDSGSATVYIGAGGFTILPLTLDDVPTVGTYWFKVKARALAEPNWAASTEQFIAESGTVTPPPSTGGGAVGTPPPPIVPPTPTGATAVGKGADLNLSGKVGSVDFSILLFFWKTSPPFSNPYVDINKDGKVDSVDFSIMLYQWGGPGINVAIITKEYPLLG